MKIPAICVVGDKYRQDKWPRSFAAVPRPGIDMVTSRFGTVLRVQDVIHAEDNTNNPHIKVVLADLVS